MGYLAGIVFGESRREVVGDSDVEMLSNFTLEDIHKLHIPLRSAFALRASARQPSLASRIGSRRPA